MAAGGSLIAMRWFPRRQPEHIKKQGLRIFKLKKVLSLLYLHKPKGTTRTTLGSSSYNTLGFGWSQMHYATTATAWSNLLFNLSHIRLAQNIATRLIDAVPRIRDTLVTFLRLHRRTLKRRKIWSWMNLTWVKLYHFSLNRYKYVCTCREKRSWLISFHYFYVFSLTLRAQQVSCKMFSSLSLLPNLTVLVALFLFSFVPLPSISSGSYSN